MPIMFTVNDHVQSLCTESGIWRNAKIEAVSQDKTNADIINVEVSYDKFLGSNRKREVKIDTKHPNGWCIRKRVAMEVIVEDDNQGRRLRIKMEPGLHRKLPYPDSRPSMTVVGIKDGDSENGLRKMEIQLNDPFRRQMTLDVPSVAHAEHVHKTWESVFEMPKTSYEHIYEWHAPEIIPATKKRKYFSIQYVLFFISTYLFFRRTQFNMYFFHFYISAFLSTDTKIKFPYFAIQYVLFFISTYLHFFRRTRKLSSRILLFNMYFFSFLHICISTYRY